MINHILRENDLIKILDQTLLPHKIEYIKCYTYKEVADAIRQMRIRGAPAIGIITAMGIVLGVNRIETSDRAVFNREFEVICKEFLSTRPTAVNIFWAVDRLRKVVKKEEMHSVFSPFKIKECINEEADRILAEDISANRNIGRFGETLIDNGQTILTHCNAGALATGGYGTALGVIRSAFSAGKRIHVLVDETRPLLQGARLTAWELQQEGIPFTLITDNMAGECMRRGMVDTVIVGADRITSKGDVANKIGTYTLAILSEAHKIPFYVAAPISTIDFKLDSGDDIPIEERGVNEVTYIGGQRTAPEGTRVFNPAFDITPRDLIRAIITQRGILYPPYDKSIAGLKQEVVQP